jgi:hypothetical protein
MSGAVAPTYPQMLLAFAKFLPSVPSRARSSDEGHTEVRLAIPLECPVARWPI